jgi:hypothetical protein
MLSEKLDIFVGLRNFGLLSLRLTPVISCVDRAFLATNSLIRPRETNNSKLSLTPTLPHQILCYRSLQIKMYNFLEQDYTKT